MSEPDVVLAGERAALAAPRPEQAQTLARWFNDPEVRPLLAHRGLLSVEAERAFIEEASRQAAERRPASILFAVHDRDDGELVGLAGLEEVDWGFGRASFGIFLGQRRGRGLGTEATRLVLDWAFLMMGLHNVLLEVYDSNEQARRAYLAAGFREIGVRRGAAITLGERRDVILMDAVADDFESPVLGRLR